MRIEIQNNRIRLIPSRDENERVLEESYIERVLGLKKAGDVAVVRRINVSELSCLAYLEIRAKEGA